MSVLANDLGPSFKDDILLEIEPTSEGFGLRSRDTCSNEDHIVCTDVDLNTYVIGRDGNQYQVPSMVADCVYGNYLIFSGDNIFGVHDFIENKLLWTVSPAKLGRRSGFEVGPVTDETIHALHHKGPLVKIGFQNAQIKKIKLNSGVFVQGMYEEFFVLEGNKGQYELYDYDGNELGDLPVRGKQLARFEDKLVFKGDNGVSIISISEKKWLLDIDCFLPADAALDDDVVVVKTFGNLSVFDSSRGELMWHLDHEGDWPDVQLGHVILSPGYLYLFNQMDGQCFFSVYNKNNGNLVEQKEIQFIKDDFNDIYSFKFHPWNNSLIYIDRQYLRRLTPVNSP